jgi:peptidoglycan/xylan/chitin deacetylase (PgdA/CDA1 family)
MPRPFPRHRRAGLAALAVALVATVLPLQSRIASAREVDQAGQTPWRAVVASVLPTPLRSQETVRIAFRSVGIQGTGTVRLEIRAATGRLVRTIDAKVDADLREGTFRWDGRDDAGKRVENGLYRATLVATDTWGVARPSAPAGVRVERPTTARPIFRVNGAGRRVALTFDDCNFDDAWRSILDQLERRHLLASFFCSGVMVNRFPALARRTVAAGHTIGDHAYFHPNLTRLGIDGIERELEGTIHAWWNVAGITPVPYMRPPYGAYDAHVLRAVGACGFPDFVMWDVDPTDWSKPGSGVIASRVLSRVRPGSIVLMHIQPQTAAALPAILAGLRSRNLIPVSLEELLAKGTPVRTR